MRRRTKSKYKFDQIVINNRWKRSIWNRDSRWCYLGIGQCYFSPTEFEIFISILGIDFRFWFNKTQNK